MPRKYIEDFAATHKTPYLGLPQGTVHCVDVAGLSPDVESVSLGSKSTGIDRLPSFKKLRRISSPLRDEWLPIFAGIPNLEYAKFTMPKSAAIPSLKCLSQLRSLVLSCNRHQTDLKFLRGMDCLHSLCISEASITSVAPLATLTELRELYVDGRMGGRKTIVNSLSPIGKLGHLRFLVFLLGVVSAHRPLAPLHKLKELNHLYLRHDFSAADYDGVLKALPQLEEICFNMGRRWPPKQ